ncbi:phage tail tape measure protein [Streptomyces sp. NPDC055210]
MSLTVGELNAILSVDDRTVDPALRRAEQALRRSGQQMGDDAERSGQQAGEGLGEGIVRGADGRLRNARGQFVSAGRAAGAAVADGAADSGEDAGRQMAQGFIRGADGQWRNMRAELVDAVTAASLEAEAAARRGGERAGDALGERLTEGADQGGEEAAAAATGRLEKLKMGAAAIGAVAGAVLMTAMTDALEQGQITARLGAQLDATGPEAKRYGKIAGQLYADAIVEDFQGAADTIKAVASAGLIPPGATNAQIKSIATNAADLANVMEVEVGQAAQAAAAMVKNGLAKDGKEAFDLLMRGSKGLGTAGEDLLETFTEYSPIFKEAGISGKTAMGLIKQSIAGGWAKDTDKIADAFKELQLRVGEGAKPAADSLKALGLDAKQVIADMRAGGTKGEKAMDQIADKLRKLGPKSEVAKQAVKDLFGGPGEDLGVAAYKLDVDKAAKAMDGAAGSADKFGNAMRDNAGTKIEAFKRGLQQNLVEFLGGPVLGSISKAKDALGGFWDGAGKGGQQGVDRFTGFFTTLGAKFVEKGREMGPKIIQGLVEGGQRAAEWVMANPTQVLKIAAIGAALVAAIVLLPATVAAAISAAAIAIVYSFVGRMLSALNENLPKWWASFTGWISTKAGEVGGWLSSIGRAFGTWFSGLWSRYVSGPVSRTGASFMAWVRGLPGRAVAALAPLGARISASATGAWNRFKAASVARALSMVAWVQGLPGRINRGIGSLGSLLNEKGRQVVTGLWAGIKSMGGWIQSQISSWAKSVIPGPIAKALGIASPSKVTTAQGRWIARGLVAGLTGSQKQVRAAAYKLTDIVRDSLAGSRRIKALKKINKAAGWLDWLAVREGKVASKLKAATKKLADLRKERDKLAADVKKGVLDGADITKQDTGGWPQTADTILAGLKQDRIAAETFAKHLSTLRKKGVRSDLIAQIAQAGVEGGASSAAALANANKSQIKQVNAQQKLLVTAAGKAGTTAGSAMYSAGVQAAQGLVKGLKKQEKTIQATMLRIARGMTASIRKALGIKSPSRVMAQVGVHTAQGLIRGVEGQRSAVNRTMAGLVDTPAAGSLDMASGRARAAASQRVVLELRSSGRGEDDYLMGRVQRGIRQVGGPDVQFALTGRRSR